CAKQQTARRRLTDNSPVLASTLTGTPKTPHGARNVMFLAPCACENRRGRSSTETVVGRGGSGDGSPGPATQPQPPASHRQADAGEGQARRLGNGVGRVLARHLVAPVRGPELELHGADRGGGSDAGHVQGEGSRLCQERVMRTVARDRAVGVAVTGARSGRA